MEMNHLNPFKLQWKQYIHICTAILNTKLVFYIIECMIPKKRLKAFALIITTIVDKRLNAYWIPIVYTEVYLSVNICMYTYKYTSVYIHIYTHKFLSQIITCHYISF
jgi:hypothetical protein